MAKKVKFTITGRVKAVNPTLRPLHTDPAFRPRKEADKTKMYTRKGRKSNEGDES